MQIIIPMAGAGQRFIDAGHEVIKPLIPVDGRPMIEHIIEMFPGEADLLFICRQEHLDTTTLSKQLQRMVPAARVVGIDNHKLGPGHTVMAAAKHIRDDQPVVISYCDARSVFPWEELKQCLTERPCDGAVLAFRGFHPHSLGSTYYAYIREENLDFQEIREKQAFTGNRMGEYASTGTYYFRNGAILKQILTEAIADDLSVKGEYYMSLPYNLMRRKGHSVRVHPVPYFIH